MQSFTGNLEKVSEESSYDYVHCKMIEMLGNPKGHIIKKTSSILNMIYISVFQINHHVVVCLF